MRVIASAQPTVYQATSASSAVQRRALVVSLPLALLFARPAVAMKNVCEGDDGDCRRRALETEAAKGAGLGNTGYTEQAKEVGKISGVNGVSTVYAAELTDAYSKQTVELMQLVTVYLNPTDDDPYNPERASTIKKLKKDSADWVAKYARGGNVRSKSARTAYVVVDGVLGHLSSSGLAPFPARKRTNLVAEIDKVYEYLAQKV